MYVFNKHFDVIVIGGGHAGIEAGLASARIGCQTLLITSNLDTIGKMSCNPAIGGIAKGQIVREIDALGGEMGLAADETGIQFRMLNTKKGPSVWAPRAQCDKQLYQQRMKSVLELQKNITIKQGVVDDFLVKNNKLLGIITNTGTTFLGTTVIVTTGTFLRGLIHIGDSTTPAGRMAEPPSSRLSESLRKMGLSLLRLKTGTPPRIHKRSINFNKIESQFGDNHPCFFSFRTSPMFHVEQIPCYVTKTTAATKEIVLKNICRSAMYSGKIQSIGPRYCPSIEDKMVKFKEKHSHQIFLEPEGRHTEEFYVNGASTSLPEDVQFDVIRSIFGLESAEIVRPAYAIEYDCIQPTALHSTLESKEYECLFFAGQINGTSGYEEAAAQGLVAGINAAMRSRGLKQIVLPRSSSYIGVMIDDLVTKNLNEPYRMFTSRAEFRLQLRQDNADLRLTPIAREIGLIDNSHWEVFTRKKNMIECELTRLHSLFINNHSYADLLRRPDISYETLGLLSSNIPDDVKQQVEIQIKYSGYIDRDIEQIKKMESLDNKLIPKNLNYQLIRGLRYESREKLMKFRPDSIGQASRIAGITPADISILLVWMKKCYSTDQNDLKTHPLA
jgi:tRNA uridine 5-carboxymethylaminomethyl modification enzyme